MIGNDVVDTILALKESNWKRPGFLEKIFTREEQSYILNSGNPDLAVWLLWSMKESAYKIRVQKHRESFFAPLRFECSRISSLHNNYIGDVYFENSCYKTTSEYINGTVFTIAFAEALPEDQIIYKKLKFPNKYYRTQHKAVYLSVLKRISLLKAKPLEQFTIKKDLYGIPEIFHRGKKLKMSLSLSHHGRYGAYAFSI